MQPAVDVPRETGRLAYDGRIATIVAALAFVLLILTSLVSFNLFHTLVELAYATVAFCVFIIAWTLREFLDDDFPVFLGTALMATALLHILHLVDYAGLDLISPSWDPPTQLWIAAGFIGSVSFLVAPFVLGHRLRMAPVVAAYLALDALVIAAVYWWRVFPSSLVEGRGLTTFKIVTEYVICGILAAAVIVLWRERDRLARGAFRYLTAALVARIVAELWFTLYTGPSTWPNLIGHVFLLLSAVLIYQAVVQDSLTRPHALAVQNLQLSEQAARSAQREEEATSRALDQLLELTPSLYEEDDPRDVGTVACEGARRLFDCDAAMLFQVDGDALRLVAIEPAPPVLHRQWLPVPRRGALAEQLARRIPTFVRCGIDCGSVTCGADRDEGVCDLHTALGLRAVLRAPISVGARADSLLALGWSTERREPGKRTLALVQRFCDQVGVALVEARRLTEQQRAESVHRRFAGSLLPNLPVDHPGLHVRTVYRPSERRLELGGDFIDVLDRGDAGVAVLVGDVSGHGPDAAALGATLRSGWEALVVAAVDPVTIAHALDEVMQRERPAPEVFATAFMAWIDPDRAEMAFLNLGHPPPFLGAGGSVASIATRAQPPLGAADRPLDPPEALRLPAGWSLVFYTDGLIEGRIAPGRPERFGEERLRRILNDYELDSLSEAGLLKILRDIEATCGPFNDDVAVVVVSAAAHASAEEAERATLRMRVRDAAATRARPRP